MRSRLIVSVLFADLISEAALGFNTALQLRQKKPSAEEDHWILSSLIGQALGSAIPSKTIRKAE